MEPFAWYRLTSRNREYRSDQRHRMDVLLMKQVWRRIGCVDREVVGLSKMGNEHMLSLVFYRL